MGRFVAALAFILLGLSLSIGCKDKSNSAGGGGGDEIPLGLYVSTTGDIADFGTATKNGVDMAVEEINASNGIGGKKIKLTFYDVRSDSSEATTAAKKLSTEDNVVAAIGEVASGLSLAAAPIFQQNGVPMVSPSSTNPTVTEKGDRIFRICYLDDFQGGACAAFAHKDLNARKAAIIIEQDSPYSVGLANFFKSTFEKLGGKVIAEEKYRSKETDFSTQVSNISKKDEKPDVVFAPVYYGDIALIAKEFRKQGLKMPLLGGDGWESPKLIQLAGEALEGSYFGNHYNPKDNDPKTQKFVKAYTEKFKEEPNSLAALGYDAVFVIKQAIENGGGSSRDQITEGLRKIKAFPGVTGTFDIDGKRNARKPISMLKIKGDKLELVRQVQPDEVK